MLIDPFGGVWISEPGWLLAFGSLVCGVVAALHGAGSAPVPARGNVPRAVEPEMAPASLAACDELLAVLRSMAVAPAAGRAGSERVATVERVRRSPRSRHAQEQRRAGGLKEPLAPPVLTPPLHERPDGPTSRSALRVAPRRPAAALRSG